MKTIVVTGGAGFIGSNFIQYVLSNFDDYSIVNVDLLTYAGNPANLTEVMNKYADRYSFVKGDICNTELMEYVFSLYKPEYVVNFAAESHVDRSIKDPNIFVTTNVMGTANLLAVAKKYWQGREDQCRFLQVSTDEVYGSLPEDNLEIMFTEETPLQPHSPYSASKTGADCICSSYYDTYGFPVLITRCSNNYGPFQFPEKLIPLVIFNAINDKSIPVYGDGKNVRDWLYVEDHCSAIWTVLTKGTLGEVYNIGGNNEIKNIDIVKQILSYLGKSEELITYVPDRLGHDRRYAIDATKMKKQLQWEPKFTFEQQIGYTIDWYRTNEQWVKNITSGEYLKWIETNYTER